jgi:hypothetical protein
MANASYNMSFEPVVNSTVVRSTFRPQVAMGGQVISLQAAPFHEG